MAECLKPITISTGSRYVKNSRGPIVHFEGGKHVVPCGKCAYCLQSKRSAWMFRVHHEMRTNPYRGVFLTLTYDERHVMRVGNDGRLSLRFRDVQLFLKRVRKDKFYAKYICVGEYGPETGRPHYHVIIWTNCPDVKLEGYWKMGRIHFGRLSMASAMYTLKYIIQPKPPSYEGVERPRAQFSKGLGLGYLTSAVYEWHTADENEPIYHSIIDGAKVALPRYYRNKIFTKWQNRCNSDRVKLEVIREKRKEVLALMKKGIVRNVSTYILSLRVENARRIIQKTKFNLQL